MQQVVSITRQGQVTIPVSIRTLFNITEGTKATVRVKNNQIILDPKPSFSQLSGSLKSKVKLSDVELKKARKEFSRQWAKIN